MTWALLPVKDLVQAKTRLSGVLAPHERRHLAQAMVEDVLSVLCEVRGLQGIQLLSDDPAAGLLAHKYQVELMEESALGCSGLNPVIEAGVGLLAAREIDRVMVVHCDVPLVQVGDLEEFLSELNAPGVDLLLCPDLEGTGTNLMGFEVSHPPEFHYGPGSCQAHLASAQTLGQRARLWQNARIGLDVDTPADLLHLFHQLQTGARGKHTADALLNSGIAQRLSLMERAGLNPLGGMENHDAV